MMPREPIPTVVRKLAKELAEPAPMRRGSVSERFMKCGQKECRCQHDPQARHGPYFTLTRSEEGKTRSRYLSAEQAALARQHVEAGLRAVGRHSTGSLPGGLTRGRQKKGFKTAFGVEIVTEIEALLGTVVVDEWDLEAIETAARRMAMRVAARVVEQRLNADTSDHAGPRGYPESS